MSLPNDQLARLWQLDSTGAAAHGFGLVERYLPAISRQHRLVFEAWTIKEYSRALCELHFFLTALDRVCDGLQIAAGVLGGALATHVESRDHRDYRDARNHFEHLEDRLYGSRRNAPQPAEEVGSTRTIHYGLVASTKEFRWGNRRIDISEVFLKDFVDYADRARAITLGSSENGVVGNGRLGL